LSEEAGLDLVVSAGAWTLSSEVEEFAVDNNNVISVIELTIQNVVKPDWLLAGSVTWEGATEMVLDERSEVAGSG
jgi:hypothetical protein